MTKTVKIVIAVAVCLVVVAGAVLGGVFGARLVEAQKLEEAKRQAEQERFEAGVSIAQRFLASVNTAWSADLTTEELQNLEDAGDYVVFEGWTNLVVSVLLSSSLQTSKLQALADAITSEQGRQLFGNFAENAELLIPLLRQVGFTDNDIASLVYSLVVALVNDGESTLKAMRETLLAIRSEKSALNVQKNLSAVTVEIGYFTFSNEERQDVLDTLADAKNAIEKLASFAYSTSITSLTDHMIEVISSEDGALSDVSNSEIQSVVQGMISNVRNLKDAMTADEIAKLNLAIQKFTNKFDGNLTTTRIFAQIVNYAKYAYILTDSIPYLCSVAIAASNIVDESFLNTLKNYTDNLDNFDSTLKDVNQVLLISRAFRAVLENIERAELESLVNVLATQAEADYRRALPIVVLDACVNLIALRDSSGDEDEYYKSALHPELWDKDSFLLEGFLVAKYLQLSIFETAYYNYLDGEISISQLETIENNCQLDDLGITAAPYDSRTETKAWYEYYMSNASAKMSELIDEILPVLKDDLLACIDDYYVENSLVRAKLDEFANKPLLEPLPDNASDADREERRVLIEEYNDLAIEARIYWVYMLAVVAGIM